MVEHWQIEIPMELPSLANQRLHFGVKASQAARQRKTVARALRRHVVSHRLRDEGIDVLLVRVSPCKLDGDNLQRAFKAVRDQVADWLDLDNDRDPRVRWCYEQAVDEQHRKGYQAARITLAPMYRLGHDPGLIEAQAQAVMAWLARPGPLFPMVGDDLDVIRSVLRME